MKKQSAENEVLRLARKTGVLRIKDLKKHELHPEHVRRLIKKGLLIRQGRGIYSAADLDFSANHGLALACKRIPEGVVCLISALHFHEIGTQLPHEIWMAIEGRAAKPKIDYPPVRIVRFSGRAFWEGIEEHVIDHVKVRIYNPAKTIADCFKYRNKIGLDVTLEAVSETCRYRKANSDQLWFYAKVCRVTKVMRPYLEAMAF